VALNLWDQIDSCGTSTVKIGNWTKQADECWAPSQQATQLSMILEIGLSESVSRLALDIRGWLETAGSTIGVAITMNINRNCPQIIIKRWELCARQYSVATRASPASTCTDEINITRQNNTTAVSRDKFAFPETCWPYSE
jgi:hypothetical protein